MKRTWYPSKQTISESWDKQDTQGSMILTLLFLVLEREKLLITSTTAVSAFSFAQLFRSSTEKCITWCTQPQSHWRFLHISLYILKEENTVFTDFLAPFSDTSLCNTDSKENDIGKLPLLLSPGHYYFYQSISESRRIYYILFQNQIPIASAEISDFSPDFSQKQLGWKTPLRSLNPSNDLTLPCQ